METLLWAWQNIPSRLSVKVHCPPQYKQIYCSIHKSITELENLTLLEHGQLCVYDLLDQHTDPFIYFSKYFIIFKSLEASTFAPSDVSGLVTRSSILRAHEPYNSAHKRPATSAFTRSQSQSSGCQWPLTSLSPSVSDEGYYFTIPNRVDTLPNASKRLYSTFESKRIES